MDDEEEMKPLEKKIFKKIMDESIKEMVKEAYEGGYDDGLPYACRRWWLQKHNNPSGINYKEGENDE